MYSTTGTKSGDRKSRERSGRVIKRREKDERKRERESRRVASSSSSSCSAARRIPGQRCALRCHTQPRRRSAMSGSPGDQYFGSGTRRPERGRVWPIAGERARSRPSPGTRRSEFPTTGGVAGSVAVREWSPRDVWYRNRECARGIKSRRFSFRSRSTLSRSSVSRARYSLRLGTYRSETEREGKAGKKKKEENGDIPVVAVV